MLEKLKKLSTVKKVALMVLAVLILGLMVHYGVGHDGFAGLNG